MARPASFGYFLVALAWQSAVLKYCDWPSFPKMYSWGANSQKNISFIDFVGFVSSLFFFSFLFFDFVETFTGSIVLQRKNDAFLSLLKSGDFHDWPGLGQFWVFFSPLPVSSRGLTGEGSAMLA